MPRELLDTTREAIAAALADLRAGRVRTAIELAAALDLLELAPYREVDGAAEPARIAAEVAREIGDELLATRAQLVRGDLLGRQGRTAESVRMLITASNWAREQQNPQVLAHSHYLMSTFYHRLGDVPSAMQHALQALESAPGDDRPELQAEHMFVLAIAFDQSGNIAEAVRRYQDVAEAAARLHHPRLGLNALNNLACVHTDEGQLEEAAAWVSRMWAVTAQYRIELSPMHRDTAAKVRLLQGSPQAALDLLAVILSPAG